MVERHIVVRERPGATGESVRDDTEHAKWAKHNPDGQVVYDSAGVLDGRKLIQFDDHELVLDKNYASCSCQHWSVAATKAEAERLHGDHVRHADRNGLVSCIFCGRVDTTFLLAQNHGFEMGYVNGERVCMAMHLRRNHVRYVAKQPAEIRVRDLPEYVELAREVWARHGDTWLNEYEALCRPIPVPTHQPRVESEEVSLW